MPLVKRESVCVLKARLAPPGGTHLKQVTKNSSPSPNASSLTTLHVCSSSLQKQQIRATAEQKAALEAAFIANKKPNPQERAALATEIGLTAKFIDNWFGARRQKEKKRSAEEDGAGGENGDAAEGAKEGQEGKGKRPKVAQTPVPADDAAREQLAQQLASEQAQLTEVFAAEQTLEPLNLLEGPLAEGDALKRAVRQPSRLRVSLRVIPFLFDHWRLQDFALGNALRAVLLAFAIHLPMREATLCVFVGSFRNVCPRVLRAQVACVLEGRCEGIDRIVQLVCEGLQARGEQVSEAAVRELVPEVGERLRFCAVAAQNPDMAREHSRPRGPYAPGTPEPFPLAQRPCSPARRRLTAQANSLTDESKNQMWRWRAKDASMLPDAVREEALWLRARSDG